MSHWVVLLLVIYVTLGLSRMGAAKATRIALMLTMFVVSYEVVTA